MTAPRFFITNRFPKGSQTSKAGRTFRFDSKNNTPSVQMYFCEAGDDAVYTEVMSAPMLEKIGESGYKRMLFYLHGYNTPPQNALGSAKVLQALCDVKMKNEVLVVPLIWPCDDDHGLFIDYFDDRTSARASATAFSRILTKFLDWRQKKLEDGKLPACMIEASLIAHSMGNLVLREGLDAYKKSNPKGMPFAFRNTFMMAPDIANDSLAIGEKGEIICKVSENVVVYHAIDDLALQVSRKINFDIDLLKRRLGTSGPKDMRKVPDNVYTVNCNSVNTLYDMISGHNYFLKDTDGKPGQVFTHMFQCITSGNVYSKDENVRSFKLK